LVSTAPRSRIWRVSPAIASARGTFHHLADRGGAGFDLGGAPGRLGAFAAELAGLLRDLPHGLGDLLGGVGGLARQRFHFASHHAEAAAGIAGARGLDGGVECEQVGLLGDRIDGLRDLGDLFQRLAQAGDLAFDRGRAGRQAAHVGEGGFDISAAALPAFLAAFSTAPAMRSLAATIASAAVRNSSNCWAWLATTLATSSIEPAASASCTPREPAFSAIFWANPESFSDVEFSDSRIMRTSSAFISKT